MSTDAAGRKREQCESPGCGAPSEGWENGWRLRLCFKCAANTRDCNGHEIDYSPDDITREDEYRTLVRVSLEKERVNASR